MRKWLLGLGTLALVVPVTACIADSDDEKAIRDNPVVIAHRGASGYLPEHTLPAYTLAYSLGADYIESDLVTTKDGVLVALHDPILDKVTDVADKYPDRKRDDGHWYVIDFSLDELKRLNVHERYDDRYRQNGQGFQIATYEEVLQLVTELNKRTGCDVGIYPELKAAKFYREQGVDAEKALLQLLAKYGYKDKSDNVYIQSFDAQTLKEVHSQSDIRLVQLISTGKQYRSMITAKGMDDIATYAAGIGPNKGLIEDKSGQPVKDGELVKLAHERGLEVHPYTFRADRPAAGHDSFADEISSFKNRYHVDGFFTDHTDQVRAALGKGSEQLGTFMDRCK